MNKAQRAQVVELLRCAADCDVRSGGIIGMVLADRFLEVHGADAAVAWDAYGDAVGEQLLLVDPNLDDRRRHLLEAALRVELREYP